MLPSVSATKVFTYSIIPNASTLPNQRIEDAGPGSARRIPFRPISKILSIHQGKPHLPKHPVPSSGLPFLFLKFCLKKLKLEWTSVYRPLCL